MKILIDELEGRIRIVGTIRTPNGDFDTVDRTGETCGWIGMFEVYQVDHEGNVVDYEKEFDMGDLEKVYQYAKACSLIEKG